MASRTRLVSRSAIPMWGKDISRAAKKAVYVGSVVGAREAAARVPLGDGRSGITKQYPGRFEDHARDTIHTLPIGRMKRGGWRAAFGSADPTILWLDKGTLGGRTTKVKGGSSRERNREIRRKFLRSTKEGRATGIKARRFMKPANDAALAASIVALKMFAGRKFRYPI